MFDISLDLGAWCLEVSFAPPFPAPAPLRLIPRLPRWLKQQGPQLINRLARLRLFNRHSYSVQPIRIRFADGFSPPIHLQPLAAVAFRRSIRQTSLRPKFL